MPNRNREGTHQPVQRIRDPLHNLIEFDPVNSEIERILWKVIQTGPFQRLRRIKQLGFSEFVFPGASHTRFAHSVGVFHTARMLAAVVDRELDREERSQRDRSLAAALVHDIGHGPFSHSFEAAAKRLKLPVWEHEEISDHLIRHSEISEELNTISSGFADDVADIIIGAGSKNIYSTIVSSQFDADRLDYMRRDRLMTGTQHAHIDFSWLLANLEVAQLPYGVDETKVADIDTFVVGPKALFAAETYIHSLFQLYPTVYFHKTTRAAEAIFQELFVRVVTLVLEGSLDQTGLAANHPIARYAMDSNVNNFLLLDDTVVTGALPILKDAVDPAVAELAKRLWERKFYKSVDLTLLPEFLALGESEREAVLSNVKVSLLDWSASDRSIVSRMLIDEGRRSPYKPFDRSKGPLEQIMVRTETGALIDLRDRSEVYERSRSLGFSVYTYGKTTKKLSASLQKQ